MFEHRLQDVGKAAATFPGHEGLVVLPDASSKRAYTYLFRFDSYAHLQAWEQSAEKAAWVRKLKDILEAPASKQFITGLEYWFPLPKNATAPPSRYEMAVVTVLAIYPLSVIVPAILQPPLQDAPLLVAALVRACVLVTLMTYAVMPLMTRLFSRWLFKPSEA
jgi:antibiotic biosynthesis monooxygenase (ABM) superfamily enzyme